MKISKHFDERPNLRVSTTFQRQIQTPSRSNASYFCKINSSPSSKSAADRTPPQRKWAK